MARPTLLTKELAGQIVQLVEVGQYPEDAALSVGLDGSTYYKWMKRGRESLKAVKAGEQLSEADTPYVEFLQSITRARAKARGRFVTILALAAEQDWRAAAHYLERTDPKRWGRRDRLALEGKVRHSGKVEQKVTVDLTVLSDDELWAYRRIVEKLQGQPPRVLEGAVVGSTHG